MSRRNEIEVLRMRQRVHDFHKANPGISIGDMRTEFDLSYASLKDWLTRPRPTDEDIAAHALLMANRATDQTGQVPTKIRLEPDIYARLRRETDLQGASMNRIANCAILLYLDCMERARRDGSEPINIMGYRA
jgi:hypothetical protein